MLVIKQQLHMHNMQVKSSKLQSLDPLFQVQSLKHDRKQEPARARSLQAAPNVRLPRTCHFCACRARRRKFTTSREIGPVRRSLRRRRNCAFAEVERLVRSGHCFASTCAAAICTECDFDGLWAASWRCVACDEGA